MSVIEESQEEEEAGFALCTFPVPCSCVCSGRDPTSPTKRDDIATLTVDWGRVFGVKPKPPLACGIWSLVTVKS